MGVTSTKGSSCASARRPWARALRHVSVLTLPLLAACAAEPSALSWQVSFACEADRERTTQVSVGIAEGECGNALLPVYQVAITREDQQAASPPLELPAGPYAFYATALDATGLTVSYECESVELPRSGAVELVLGTEVACADPPTAMDSSSGADPMRGMKAITELCASDAECASGECCTTENCGGGMCTQTCATDNDCPAGTLCEHQVCFAACSSDAECPHAWLCTHMATICEAM